MLAGAFELCGVKYCGKHDEIYFDMQNRKVWCLNVVWKALGQGGRL